MWMPRTPGAGSRGFALAAALVASPLLAMGGAPGPDPTAARARLVQEVEAEVRQTAGFLGTDRLDPAVLHALGSVPRERFVPQALRGLAYADRPLPIGQGQTISQPYIVAIMSHLAGIRPGDRVYELGTGSGYQAAVLAAMGAEVYSVEIVPELAARAAALIAELGCAKVRVRAGDGYLGWPEAAPFAAVMVTAAGPQVSQALVDQLAVGGRLVMPLGGAAADQVLVVLTKRGDGTLERRDVLPVRFVPITGGGAPAAGPGR